jgi:hypothetical protein
MTDTATQLSEYEVAVLLEANGDPYPIAAVLLRAVEKLTNAGYLAADSGAVGSGSHVTDAGRAYLASLGKR